MIARELPVAEWPRLVGTEAETVWPSLNPENAAVLVVEDEGRIVGTWIGLRVVHAECISIAPSHRGSFGVAKRLLKGMREIAARWGADQVVTGSVSPHVTDLIERLGGFPVPCESFVIPFRGDAALGRSFHAQLSRLVAEDQHPEDERHNERVGLALRTAIERRDPARATDDYNAWAAGAGYQPIKYLGMVEGRIRADIVTAVIDIDERYNLSVVSEVERCQQPQP